MQYTNLGNHYVIRLVPGEDVGESLLLFCKKEKIASAYFTMIGACRDVELAHYNLEQQKYTTKVFSSPTEVASLTGNIALYDGSRIVHMHGVFSDETMAAHGGHIMKAVIHAAGEIFLTPYDTTIEKHFDKETGLKLMKLQCTLQK